MFNRFLYCFCRYLDLYEKVHLHGEDPDSRVFEDEDETSRLKKRNSAPINTVPSVYNHHQHDIPSKWHVSVHLICYQQPFHTGRVLDS